MKPLFILGAGGHGKEIASYVAAMNARRNEINFLGFIDDNKSKGSFAGAPILGGMNVLAEAVQKEPKTSFYYMTAAGSNEVREKFVQSLHQLACHNLFPISIQYNALVGENSSVDEGTLLAPGSIVTVSSKIGKHCILNIKSSVSHDAIIGDFCNLNPSATICGDVRLGRNVYVGAGATIIEKITIGNNVTIGAGAVVTKDLPDNVTAVGVPAKIIKTKS